jgi:hypothetical protein
MCWRASSGLLILLSATPRQKRRSSASIPLVCSSEWMTVREVSFTLKPGEMSRQRTGWRDPISLVKFHLRNGEGLQFDNLASLYE